MEPVTSRSSARRANLCATKTRCRSIPITSINVKQIISAWLHPDITSEIMWQHFFYPHLTLGKPIFHPGHFSFRIQTGTYFTSPEKTWFTKIRPRKFQTNIQSEYHRKNPRASSPFTFFPPCFKISQFFSITVRLSQVSFYWDCLVQANKRYHGNHWLRKNYNSHCLGYVRSLWYSGPHYTSS